MSDNFVTYEQALALKELGFDEKCFKYWVGEIHEKTIVFVLDSEKLNDDELFAPLKQQAFRWFREKYDLDFYITRMLPKSTTGKYYAVVNDKWAPNSPHDSYEEAENDLIDSLIGMAKLQQKNDKDNKE